MKLKPAEVDLAIVVRAECGCFGKWYYEAENIDALAVDSDIDFCRSATSEHRLQFTREASKAAKNKADEIRNIWKTKSEEVMDTHTDDLPEGYYCLENQGDVLIIGVGFEHFNEEAPAALTVGGQVYTRGRLEPLTPDLASSLCSVRAYQRKK
jgi:hypothetical protein